MADQSGLLRLDLSCAPAQIHRRETQGHANVSSHGGGLRASTEAEYGMRPASPGKNPGSGLYQSTRLGDKTIAR